MTDSNEEARQALYLEGLALFGKEDHDAALVKYDEALALDPDWTEALHGKAMRGKALAARCLMAEDKRASLLKARVDVARQLMRPKSDELVELGEE